MNIPAFLYTIGLFITYPFRRKPKEQPYSDDLAVWGDDMSYCKLSDEDKDARKAIRTAKKYAGYKEYDPQFRIGNLYIINTYSPPPRFTLDASGQHDTVGVILGKRPRFVRFPNQELFEHFMRLTRNDPGVIRNLSQRPTETPAELRTRVAILLSTGVIRLLDETWFKDPIFKEAGVQPELPTWEEDNGTLTIRFYTTHEAGFCAQLPTRYIVTVDTSQKYTFEDTDIEDLAYNRKNSAACSNNEAQNPE